MMVVVAASPLPAVFTANTSTLGEGIQQHKANHARTNLHMQKAQKVDISYYQGRDISYYQGLIRGHAEEEQNSNVGGYGWNVHA